MKLTKNEKQILNYFFTNLDKNVFVLTNMPEILKGALFSRYSRSARPLRDLFFEEYLNNEEINVAKDKIESFADPASILATDKAQKFYTKWLAEYGDDSIAELGGEHLGVEEVSVLATKSMEDRRIGLSPLEKSTRYVRFDDKVDGKYKYYRDAQIMNSRFSKSYEQAMDFLFDTYSELIDPMITFFKSKYPQPEGVSDKAYESSVRAKACDILRGLLPLSTLTNMGIFGNGRAYEYMLTKMFANELSEVNGLAESIYEELDKVIHNFIERIKSEKGESYQKYLKETQESVEKYRITKKITKDLKVSVSVLDWDRQAEDKVIACILYPLSNIPWDTVLSKVKSFGKKKKLEILTAYFEKRLGRWHKIGRAFEDSYYQFEIVSDFGAYKDLERHRILTQDKQLFTCDLGYDVPKDVIEAGFEKKYRKAMDNAQKVFDKLREKMPLQAQYAVTHGYKVRYRFKMNLREAFHLCELRSSPQGHPNYRFIAQEMFTRIKEVHPNLGAAMKFVNMGNPGLERLSAEVRKEEKLKKFV